MTDAPRWRLRLLYALCTWLLGWVVLAALGTHPQPVLLALATVSGYAVGGAILDAQGLTDRADWVPPHRAKPRQWGIDPRFSRLSQSFHDGTDPQVVAERVHTSLLQVVDGLLLSRHSIDRQEDPQAARDILGDEVVDYLERPPRYRRGLFQQLPSLLTRIESL